MVKLVISLIVALALLIFASQNMHTVWVRFVAGPATQMPLIVLIAGSVVVGYAIATYSHLVRRVHNSKDSSELDDE